MRPKSSIIDCRLYVFLLTILFAYGCRERELISSPPVTVAPAQNQWVRVLLAKDAKSCAIMSYSSYLVKDTVSGDVLARSERNSTAFTVSVSSGQFNIGSARFSSRQISIIPDIPFVFYLNDKGYRGELWLNLNAAGETFDIINNVPLETYLAGVVGAEMPGYWEPEALKAQAIASRTYCLYVKKRYGWQRSWDVNKTQANQMYLGLEAESPKVWDAVNQTAGKVLNCHDASGNVGIFPTYFSSACGGHTEDSKKVFGESFSPLGGVECPWCRQTAARDIFYWPVVKIDKAELTSQIVAKYPSLSRLGGVSNIIVDQTSQREGFQRIMSVKLVGANGQTSPLKGEDLRLAIDPTGRKIRSTICKISSNGQIFTFFSGRGFGHGVGLCQYGALGMARSGASYFQILSHYYPGAQIAKAY